MKGFIYKLVNKSNGKFYVGSTLNLQKREKRHLNDLKSGTHHCIHLQNAFNKYGEDVFEFSFREYDITNENQLRMLEERYINFCWKSGMLYNVSKKGSGGDLISYHPKNKEFRKKQSILSKERYNNLTEEEKKQLSERLKGEGNPNFGNRWSKELREKVSKKAKEYYLTHSNYIKGKTYEEFFGEEKAKELKKKLSERSKLKVGEKNPFYGKHHSEETKKILSKKNLGCKPGNSKKVLYQGEVYESANECSRKLGIPMVTVAYRCRNNIYGFSYVGENDNLPQRVAKKMWTFEECEELASKCSTIKEFSSKYKLAYGHLITNKKEYEEIKNKYFKYLRTYWTLDKVMDIVKKYESYKDFRENEQAAYSSVTRHKWSNVIKEYYEIKKRNENVN